MSPCTGVDSLSSDGSIGDIDEGVLDEGEFGAPGVHAFGCLPGPGSITQTGACLVPDQGVILFTGIPGGGIEGCPGLIQEDDPSPGDVIEGATVDVSTGGCRPGPESVRLTPPVLTPLHHVTEWTVVPDDLTDPEILLPDRGVLVLVRGSTIAGGVLADPGQVVQVTGDIVPQPPPATVQDDAILLSVVVVGLILGPEELPDYLTVHPSPDIGSGPVEGGVVC